MGQFCYDYPRPAVAADIAVLHWRQQAIQVLLIQRGRDPFAGHWALPGGFVEIDEPLEDAARREIQEETGLSDLALKELGMFGRPGRDPRGRTISIAYYAVIPADRQPLAQHGDDASDTRWFDIHSLPPLAFDHTDLMRVLLDRLRRGVLYFFEGFDFTGPEFTLSQLQQIHQAVLNHPVNTELLRQRLLHLDLLQPAGKQAIDPQGNPEPIYRLNRDSLDQIQRHDVLAPLQIN